jgi:hypothetical protein
LEGGPPGFRPRFTGAVLLRNIRGRSRAFAYGTIALCGARFHTLQLARDFVTPAEECSPRMDVLQPPAGNACTLAPAGFGLIPFRSPLLGESRLISFPPGTEMFQFPGLPPPALCIQAGVTPHYRRRVSPFGNPRVKARSAAHRGLSQPSTSFIDSRCQGIHRMPFLS